MSTRSAGWSTERGEAVLILAVALVSCAGGSPLRPQRLSLAPGTAKEDSRTQGGLSVASPSEGMAAREDGPVPLDLVSVPAACFLMGYDEGDFDERPRHEVCVGAFSIDRVEASNGAYGRCVEAGVCRPPTRYPARPALSLPDRPVVGVGWTDADRYCRWAGMRLPTDAEWELAAGGTDGRRYPWGDERPSCELAVFARCPPYSTVSVDSYPLGASPYGALHMGGNVWEWVWDWWSSAYYRSAPRQDPTGPERGGMRGLRGGCWNRTPWHVRVADRDSGVVGLRNDHVGFRCACSGCGPSRPAPGEAASDAPSVL